MFLIIAQKLNGKKATVGVAFFAGFCVIWIRR
jgi:hypothetical protein